MLYITDVDFLPCCDGDSTYDSAQLPEARKRAGKLVGTRGSRP